MDEYRPKDQTSLVEMNQAINKVNMNENDNPKKLFRQLTIIQTQYGKAATPELLMAKAISVTPEKFKQLVTSEQINKGNGFKLADLKNVMNTHWRLCGGTDEEDESEKTDELALGAFDGACYECGKQGHRAYDCPNKKGGGKGRG